VKNYFIFLIRCSWLKLTFKNGGYWLNKSGFIVHALHWNWILHCDSDILKFINFELFSVIDSWDHGYAVYVMHFRFCFPYMTRAFRGAWRLFICRRHCYGCYVTTGVKRGGYWCERPRATSCGVNSVCCGRWRMLVCGRYGVVFSLCLYVLSKQNMFDPTD
jgi:hypothetical protein